MYIEIRKEGVHQGFVIWKLEGIERGHIPHVECETKHQQCGNGILQIEDR